MWENLGPTHEDRLAALAERFPGTVAAVQFNARSPVYGWTTAEATRVPTTTLALPGEGRDVWRGPLGRWRLGWRLFAACRRSGARDVYLCHYDEPAVLGAAVLLRLAGRRVFCMIDSKHDDRRRSAWREWVKRVFLAPYSGALAGSPRSRDYLRRLGMRRRPVALGYDALSVDRIRSQADAPPAPEGLPHAQRDFLVVARLVPKKNIALAIDAYARWVAAAGGTRALRILGSGPLEGELRRQAGALGVGDRVAFAGFVQTDEVSRALGRALCLILPSSEEQFGLVVIEAMAMGVPALVSANAGAVDVMIDDGVNGRVIDPLSCGPLLAAMTALDRDAEGWAVMARAARAGSGRGDVGVFVAGVAALSGLESSAADPLTPRRR